MKRRRKHKKQSLEFVPNRQTAYLPEVQKKSVLNDTDKKVIRIASYTVGSALIGTVGFFLIRRQIIKNRSYIADEKATVVGTAENFAKRIRMAFDNDGWWGTDMNALRAVYHAIPDQETYNDVKKAYQNMTREHQGELGRDLESELTSGELQEIESIISIKPKKKGQLIIYDRKWATLIATRFKAAFDYTIMGMPSTDKGAVLQAIIDIPSQLAFHLVDLVYDLNYGLKLTAALSSELDMFDFDWKDLIAKKPKK